jgi:hypothetical protein
VVIVDDPRGGFFVFDGVMVLAAGLVLPDRQDVFFNCAVCVKLFWLCVTSRVHGSLAWLARYS